MMGNLARQEDLGGFVDTVDPDLAKYPPDYNASNYSIQPPYTREQALPDARWAIGALAANDAYQPDEGGANAAMWQDPNEIAAARLRGPYVNPPRRVGDDPFTRTGESIIDSIAAPGRVMQPNPYPEGSELADWYDRQRMGGEDWAPSMALNMMSGGVAGTGAKAGEIALAAGYDPKLWHGVSSIKLPKPIDEMSSVLRPVNPAPETVIGPARLQNSMLMPLLGDRSAAASALERVNGFPFENAVSLEGGHGYMANNPEMAWAAGKSIAPGIARVVKEGAAGGLPVHGVYTAMGERSVDFSHMVSDTLAEMAKHTKITPEGEAIFNDTMKKIAPDFPGVLSPDVAAYLRGAPGELRNVFAKTMDTGKMQKLGFPSVAEARVAVTDPRLLNEPTGAAGLSVARMDPKGTLGPSGHGTYDTGIAGDYIGGLPASVPKEVMFPDIVGPLSKHGDAVEAARVAAGKTPFRPTEDYLMGRVPVGLPKLQEANQQWVDSVSKHLEDRGFTLGSGATDEKTAAAIQGIKAYHSSPHDFDRFDLSKIGTGEGAQVYGHGLYFAENPAVSGQGGQYWKQFANRFGKSSGENTATEYLARAGFDREKAVQTLRDALANPPEYTSGYNKMTQERMRQEALKMLESGQPVGPRTYEVNINADPAHMLDWDKPLREQQQVLDALSGSRRKAVKETLGRQDYLAPTRETYGRDIGQSLRGDARAKYGQQAASQAIQAGGIPGIKYLDEGSRGTANIPQLEAAISGLQQKLQMMTPSQRSMMADTHNASLARWQAELEHAKANPPTHNYVIFDPSKIDILKKYGIAGAAPVGLGALAAQDAYQPEER